MNDDRNRYEEDDEFGIDDETSNFEKMQRRDRPSRRSEVDIKGRKPKDKNHRIINKEEEMF